MAFSEWYETFFYSNFVIQNLLLWFLSFFFFDYLFWLCCWEAGAFIIPLEYYENYLVLYGLSRSFAFYAHYLAWLDLQTTRQIYLSQQRFSLTFIGFHAPSNIWWFSQLNWINWLLWLIFLLVFSEEFFFAAFIFSKFPYFLGNLFVFRNFFFTSVFLKYFSVFIEWIFCEFCTFNRFTWILWASRHLRFI